VPAYSRLRMPWKRPQVLGAIVLNQPLGRDAAGHTAIRPTGVREYFDRD
jgi:hypothetical protein